MNICVFLSAYDESGTYEPIVAELGERIGQGGHTLVYGASDQGLMRVIAQTARVNGAPVIGVTIPKFQEVAMVELDELIVAEHLEQRKQYFMEKSDAFVVLPGGIGTVDELAFILEMKKHKAHQKTVAILNLGGFYDPLRQQLLLMEERGFLSQPLDYYVQFVSSVDELFEILAT